MHACASPTSARSARLRRLRCTADGAQGRYRVGRVPQMRVDRSALPGLRREKPPRLILGPSFCGGGVPEGLTSPVSVSLFPPLGNPNPQADRGACGHTFPRWPCTGLLMIGESVAGLSRRLRVSFGEESQEPAPTPNCVFLSEFCGKYTTYIESVT